MSELNTADELLERLAQLTIYDEDTGEGAIIFGDPVSREDRRKSCLAEIQAFQRNALEAAAKAVCPWCSSGEKRTHDADRGWLHPTADCAADEIWDLIPVDPAPAGTETKPMENDDSE